MALLQLQHSWLSSSLTIKPTTTIFTSKTSSFQVPLSLNSSNAETSKPNSETPQQATPEPEPGPMDSVKLAFEKAEAYKKSAQRSQILKLQQSPVQDSAGASTGNGGNELELPASVKAAMEKAKEYKKNKGVAAETETNSGENRGNQGPLHSGPVDKSAKEEKLSISSIDFMGLDFADKKKSRGLPPGLVPVTDPFQMGDMPEVEIIVGDTSMFGETTTSKSKPSEEENSDLYKPKVSTWGVFPRPGNISKTFGGGKTIHPGDVLETAEERAAKDERTRNLLAAYRKKVGLSVNPKLKAECEKALKDGDSLMDSGKLDEALAYYEKVMSRLAFQSELHGLAALQWSICQDSLRLLTVAMVDRSNEARTMYEKLQSHPNAKVSKKAVQLLFSFQATEMMRVTGSKFSPTNIGYQNYFDAFIDRKADIPVGESEIGEGALSQTLPYVFFLVSPIVIVLFIAVQRGNIN